MKLTDSIIPIFIMILLSLPVQAHADWSGAGMRPALAPNFVPNQGQSVQHQARVNVVPQVRLQPQHHVQQQPVTHNTSPIVNRTQVVRQDQRIDHRHVAERRMPDYFRHDANYYGHAQVIFPDTDVDSTFVVPDGFELVTLNGETFYYNQGVFYQEVNGQLTAIPAVLGAIVDYIPQDYQIVMADGVHYLFTGGVYYQRVDQGFEVVEGPVSDQE